MSIACICPVAFYDQRIKKKKIYRRKSDKEEEENEVRGGRKECLGSQNDYIVCYSL